jgi:hypothetical protein
MERPYIFLRTTNTSVSGRLYAVCISAACPCISHI